MDVPNTDVPPPEAAWAGLSRRFFNLVEIIFQVVLQESTPPQIRQFILYFY